MSRLILILLVGIICCLPFPAASEPGFADRLVAVALQQYEKYHAVDEIHSPLKEQIRIYWTGIGLDFPGVQTPWSAVFVSWCVKQAGATKSEFSFDSLHAVYIRAAIQNQLNHRGVFRACRLADVAPQPGDLLCENRGGGTISYEQAANRSDYISHGAIVVERKTGSIVTIGGNEHDSVGRREIRLQADGKIPQRDKNPYICVIKRTVP